MDNIPILNNNYKIFITIHKLYTIITTNVLLNCTKNIFKINTGCT